MQNLQFLHQSKKTKWIEVLYTDYYIGILSIIIAFLIPFLLPILGSFLAVLLFLGGVIAILIAKKNWWVKLLTLSTIVMILYLFFGYYEIYLGSFLMNYLS